jgi:hypothetical protein
VGTALVAWNPGRSIHGAHACRVRATRRALEHAMDAGPSVSCEARVAGRADLRRGLHPLHLRDDQDASGESMGQPQQGSRHRAANGTNPRGSFSRGAQRAPSIHRQHRLDSGEARCLHPGATRSPASSRAGVGPFGVAWTNDSASRSWRARASSGQGPAGARPGQPVGVPPQPSQGPERLWSCRCPLRPVGSSWSASPSGIPFSQPCWRFEATAGGGPGRSAAPVSLTRIESIEIPVPRSGRVALWAQADGERGIRLERVELAAVAERQQHSDAALLAEREGLPLP